MKATLQFKILLLLLVLPLFTFANGWNGKHTKEKTIHKEYNVNANATLKVNNSYGNLDITTWNENRIVIDITITTNGNNEDKVKKKLDQIDVLFDATSNMVSARTKFEKSNSWFNWGNNNVNMKINYVIKMPITNKVDLDNDYGSINLDKLEGRAVISCDYGKVTTKELMADNNILDFDYTKNSYFEYIKSAKINADYSQFTVAKTNKLDINADYTDSNIEIAEDIEYNCDYGSLTAKKVNNVIGDGDYLTLRLGDVYNNVNIEADYGSFKVDNIAANAGDITINSDYMKITIGYDPGYNFDFELDLEYASLRGDNDFELNKQIEKSGKKYYEGYHGKSNSGNKISVNTDYGSITFKRN